MTYSFTDDVPATIYIKPVLISGLESSQLNGREYLFVKQNDDKESLYEIRYEYHCSPFKEVIISGNILAVGHEEHFYLYDLIRNVNVLSLKMAGYFGHLYLEDDLFFVADAGGLHSINKQATIIWQNQNLAIDGVVITGFTKDKIFGSGEWDPPGGWRDFTLYKRTGMATE